MARKCTLWPTYCLSCDELIRSQRLLCVPCLEELPWIGPACRHCALPMNASDICPDCEQKPPVYDALCALFDYAPPVAKWITRFKYQGQLSFGHLFSDLMVEHLTLPCRPDVILPVPLFPARQRQRGFNQTLEMAKHIKKKIRVPVDAVNCKKIRHTTPQAQVNALRRSRNIRPQAFAVSPTLKGKKVLIIEDVVTTGRTIEALSLALKQAGVLHITVWSCCRTVKTARHKKLQKKW